MLDQNSTWKSKVSRYACCGVSKDLSFTHYTLSLLLHIYKFIRKLATYEIFWCMKVWCKTAKVKQKCSTTLQENDQVTMIWRDLQYIQMSLFVEYPQTCIFLRKV